MPFETGIRIKIDSSGARAGAREVRAATDSVKGSFNNLRRSLFSVQNLIGTVFASLAVRKAVREFAEFERGLISVGKTTGLAGRELQNLGSDIQNIATVLPVTTEELLSLGQAAGQLGVSGSENIVRFAETVGKLGLASNLSGEQAATSLARILTATKTAVADVDRLGSTIVRLGNNFAATEAEIAHTALAVSQNTAIFRLTAAEVVGIGTALKALGVEAEAGGSQIGRAFQMIDAAVRRGGEQMRTLVEITGETGDALRKNFLTDPVQVFQSFIAGLGRIGTAGGDVTLALDEMGLSGIRSSRILGILATRSDVLANALQMANEEWVTNTALTAEAMLAATSFTSQMTILGSILDSAARIFGAELAPTIVETTTAFREFILEAQRSGEIAEIARDIGDAFRFLAENLDAIGVGLSTVLGARFLAIFGPVGALIGLVVGFVGSVVVLFSDLEVQIGEDLLSVQDIFQGTWLTISNATMQLVNDILTEFKRLEPGTGIVVTTLQGLFNLSLHDFVVFSQGLINTFFQATLKVAGAVKGILRLFNEDATIAEVREDFRKLSEEVDGFDFAIALAVEIDDAWKALRDTILENARAVRDLKIELELARQHAGEFEDLKFDTDSVKEATAATKNLDDTLIELRPSVEDFIDEVKLQNEALRLTIAGHEDLIPLLLARAALERELGEELLPAEVQALKDVLDIQRELTLVIEEAAAALEAQEKAAEAAAKALARPFEQAASGIQRAFSDAFANIFSGGVNTFANLAETIKEIFIRLAAEIATLLVFKPVVSEVLGAVGLGDLAQGILGQTSGGGGIPNIFGGGNFASDIAGQVLTSIGGPFVSTVATTGGSIIGLGLGGGVGAPVAASAAGAIAGPGTATALSSLGAGLAAAAPFLLAAGAILIPMLFGGGPPTAGSAAFAQVRREDDGFGVGETGEIKGGNIDAVVQVARAAADTLAAIEALIGSPFITALEDRDPPHTISFVNLRGADSETGLPPGFFTRFVTDPATGQPGGERLQEIFSDPEAFLGNFLQETLRRSVATTAFDLPPEFIAAVENSAAETGAAFIDDLNFALAVADIDFTSIVQPLSRAERVVQRLTAAFEQAAERAESLGISIVKIEAAQQEAFDLLTVGFNEAITQQILGFTDPLAAQLAALAAQQGQRLADATTFGADLVAIERLTTLERIAVLEQFGVDTIASLVTAAFALTRTINEFNADIAQQVLGFTDPLAAQLAGLEALQADRLRTATEMGADLVRVELLSGLERTEILAAAAATLADEARRTAAALADAARATVDFNAGVLRQVLQATDPLAALELVQAARLDEAILLGADLVQLERLNGIERARVLEQALSAQLSLATGLQQELVGIDRFVEAQRGRLEDLVRDLTLGDLSGAAPTTLLAGTRTEFERIAALAAGGNLEAIEDFPQATRTFLEVSREFFASSAGFQEDLAEVLGATRNLIAPGGELATTADLLDRNGQQAASDAAALLDEVERLNDQLAELTAQIATQQASIDALLAA